VVDITVTVGTMATAGIMAAEDITAMAVIMTAEDITATDVTRKNGRHLGRWPHRGPSCRRLVESSLRFPFAGVLARL
jgi:hypothetical protein